MHHRPRAELCDARLSSDGRSIDIVVAAFNPRDTDVEQALSASRPSSSPSRCRPLPAPRPPHPRHMAYLGTPPGDGISEVSSGPQHRALARTRDCRADELSRSESGPSPVGPPWAPGNGRPRAGSNAKVALRRKDRGEQPSVPGSASGSRLADAVAWRTSYNGGYSPLLSAVLRATGRAAGGSVARGVASAR
jgi:hypothetical protein